MGTFGTGPFDSDCALDFLDGLAELPTGQRREVLERMFLVVRNEPEQLERTVFPYEVVAAAAVVAASLAGGTSIRQKLANSALSASGRAAGRDGPWHHGWTSPDDAVRARQTTEQLAALLERERGGQDA
jgi:Domain of unknown function (DUF4259)